ncbi:hypothetical protein PENSPDRAFT_14693 [Peniophora sp. CONT]|nr:hypothetical protein PENSPDRAFT_14693 [Peniophora sp. CONT]
MVNHGQCIVFLTLLKVTMTQEHYSDQLGNSKNGPIRQYTGTRAPRSARVRAAFMHDAQHGTLLSLFHVNPPSSSVDCPNPSPSPPSFDVKSQKLVPRLDLYSCTIPFGLLRQDVISYSS